MALSGVAVEVHLQVIYLKDSKIASAVYLHKYQMEGGKDLSRKGMEEKQTQELPITHPVSFLLLLFLETYFPNRLH